MRVVGRLEHALQVALVRRRVRLRIAEVQPERVRVVARVQKRDRVRFVLVALFVDQSGERELFKLSSFLESVLMARTFPCLVLARKRSRRWVPWAPDGQRVSYEELEVLRAAEVLDWRPEFVYANGKMRKAAP